MNFHLRLKLTRDLEKNYEGSSIDERWDAASDQISGEVAPQTEITDYRQWTRDYRLQTVDQRLQITDSGLEITDYRQWTRDYRLQTVD